ncbi:MAG TPA: hypothetical protein VMY05_00380 [Acidobacteriota bacterium]|nr:hypothetical protein [Acidobacteriota bacterium]
MLKSNCIAMACVIIFASTSAMANGPVLDTNLSIFEDLIGKQWEGHFEDADESMTLYMNWEPIIDGAAVQMSGSSSSSDMTRRNIYYFDRAKNLVTFLAMTSNGYVGTGTVSLQDSVLIFLGQQVWPDGSVHDTESQWEFLSDGNVRVIAGHKILYTPVDSK